MRWNGMEQSEAKQDRSEKQTEKGRIERVWRIVELWGGGQKMKKQEKMDKEMMKERKKEFGGSVDRGGVRRFGDVGISPEECH